MIEFFTTIVQAIFERAAIFALVIVAVYLSSRIIKFDDLSIEGSFGFGGALTAMSFLYGIPAILSILVAMFGGAMTGLCTGLLHTKWGLNNLVSGIIVTSAFFSISLYLAGANCILAPMQLLWLLVPCKLALLIPIAIFVIFTMRWFLQTEIGFLLRAVGENPSMLTTLGKSIDGYKIVGLIISNSITAGAGALFVQYVGYFSIWANTGILIMSLTGLVLAQLFSKRCGLALFWGALIYQMIIAVTFEINIDQNWNKLITAFLLVCLLAVQQKINKERT
jgi:putative tryptophan/tyrosine transport system permease protein